MGFSSEYFILKISACVDETKKHQAPSKDIFNDIDVVKILVYKEDERSTPQTARKEQTLREESHSFLHHILCFRNKEEKTCNLPNISSVAMVNKYVELVSFFLCACTIPKVTTW